MIERILHLLLVTQDCGISLKKGRQGWVVTTPLGPGQARQRLSKLCERVVPIHLGHSNRNRLFVQPRWSALGIYLERNPVVAPPDLFSPVQLERLRRLSLALTQRPRHRADSRSGQALFCSIALRLAGLAGSTESGSSLWRHLASDFDRLWRTAPLFAIGLTPFQRSVVRTLQRAAGLPSPIVAPR